MARFWKTLQMLTLGSLVGCAAAARTVTYAGPVRPVAGTCEPESRGTLSLSGTGFMFAPQSGTLILQGTLAGQQLHATLVRPGADKAPYRMLMEATLQGASIEGAYSTPNCRYQLSLTKTRD